MSHARDSSPANAFTSSRTSAQKDIQRKPIKTANRPTSNRLANVNWNLSTQKRKALLASGIAATVMVAIVLPDRVSSEAIAQSNCQQVIQSGAEMSRGEIAALIAVPAGSSKQAVRQVVSEPYCTLPTTLPVETFPVDSSADNATEKARESAAEREAYPLAFDPEVWMVLSYESEKYAGYDFVFKP